jgi:polyketide cyclase/dehydrase/lipid transport protein
MTAAEWPVWALEESVVAEADPAFAFEYLASIGNMTADPGIERVEADGPSRDRVGMRGRTYGVDGRTTDWVVTAVEPGRRLVIDIPLHDAILRFAFRFEDRAGGGSIVSQRVSLLGANAGAYLDAVSSGFGPTLRDGMHAVRDRIDAAARERAST